jgi:ankyrin repeat protein
MNIDYGQREIVQSLLAHGEAHGGIDVNTPVAVLDLEGRQTEDGGQTPLFAACKVGDENIVKMLLNYDGGEEANYLKCKVDVNQKAQRSFSAPWILSPTLDPCHARLM